MFDLSRSDGKEAKKVNKQAADDVDQVKRLSSNFIALTMESYMPYTSLQKTNCGRTSTNGSPHRIHQLIITLRVIPITRRRQPGSLEAAFSGNGNQQLRCFGFMENVSTLPLLTLYRLMRSLNVAGSGKSILWLVDVYLYPSYVTNFFVSSTIIQDIKALCEAGDASMAYFYFDFRNADKQGLHDLVPSLLTQLSARSSLRCDILSKLYSVHDNGKEQPSDSVLTKCLKDMLTLPDQCPTYLIIDALDESPNTSGIPSARERVLQFLKGLVDLRLPNLHICVTSRPEIDIQDVIVPLTSLQVSLHDQTGQKDDIADYVRSIVYSNSEPIIRRWKKEDKDLVIEVLSERADGMYVDCFMVAIVVEIVAQVPMGFLSVRDSSTMSSIERQAVS